MPFIGKRCTDFLLLASTISFCNFTLANTTPDVDAVVQGAAQTFMQEYGVPGLAIAVTANGRQRFYSYGVASRETGQMVTRDTLFEIGSISKTFTATLATYALATGRLLLTEAPGRHLPPLRGSHLDGVTLINLGTHTAGGFPLQVPDDVHDAAQLMAYFKSWQPEYAPSTHRTYANPSIGLLGMVAAASMGVPFAEALEQRLFPALGMPNSYIDVPADKMGLYAQGYDKKDSPVRLNPGVLAAEAYGVKSSARDLIRFIELNLGLTETEPELERAIADTHIGYFRLGAMTQALIWEQYGYPVTVETLLEGNAPGTIYESHTVAALKPPLPPQEAVWVNKTGSTNGFSAYVAFIPAKKLGIVILANRNHPVEPRLRLAHRVLSELDCCLPAEQ